VIVEGAAETSVRLVHGEEVAASCHLTAPLALYQQTGAGLGQLGTDHHCSAPECVQSYYSGMTSVN